MKLDRFTWIVIAVVVALLAAAVVTVNVTGGRGWGNAEEYATDDAPTTPVHNAFVALNRGDLFKAREQYSQHVLDEIEEQNYDPFADRSRSNPNMSQRLRILTSVTDPEDPNRAAVTFSQDNYSRGGLFGGSSTWSREATVEVVREEDVWKIDSQEFFY